MTVPPIRDETRMSVEEALEQGLDSFDSEVSLGLLDCGARVEPTSDLDLFLSEHADADHVVVAAAPKSVVAPRAVVAAADRRAVVVATEQRAAAVPPERPAVVAAMPQRARVLARRLAVVAGIFACLGLTTLGILRWRSPAPVVMFPQVVRDVALPPVSRAQPQEPIPTLPETPTPGTPVTREPTTTPESLMPSEPVAGSRGPIATPAAPAVVALPPSTGPTARPAGLAGGASAETSETIGVPRSAGNADTATEVALSNDPSSVNPRAAPLPLAPPMLPSAAPVSTPAMTEAGLVTAAPPAPARDATDIQMVLTRYRSAFSDLDAAAVSHVWPGADSRALARAFRGLEEQGIAFDNCDIQVTGTSAAASCGGTVRYVTRVGSKDPRTERRRWQFTLGKVQDRWMIQTVESR